MRTVLIPALVLSVLLGAAHGVRGDDAKAIIAKALKAHGVADKPAKQQGIQSKSKGTLDVAGGLAFTQETSVQLPNQYKEVMQLEVNGQNLTVATVFDKDKGWIKAGDKLIDMDEKILAAVKEGLYKAQVLELAAKGEKGTELSALGEAKVNDKPAVGVKVTTKGHRDIDLWFDKEKGLLLKQEWRTVDLQSGQEVTEETLILEYQEVEGRKVAKKLQVNRDGKKFMEGEVQEVKFVEKLDDSEFAKP